MSWFGKTLLPAGNSNRGFGVQRHLDLGSDTLFCLFLLAACLLYSLHASFNYLTTFTDGILDFAGRPIGRDFVNYWTGGVAVIDGAVSRLFDFNSYHSYQEYILGLDFADHSWSYPPHMLLILWPLGGFSYLPALALWSAATLLAYLWACRLRNGDPWVVALALLLAPSSYICLAGGQNGFLTAALLIGGFRLMRTHPIIAGVLFGILTVKPQLGILLPFALMASRRWLTIVSAGVTTVFMVAASAFLFGLESWEAYFDVIVPFQAVIMNERQGEFLVMMPSAYMGLRLLGVEQEIRTAVQLLLFVIALAGVVWTFARCQDWILQLAVLTVGTFIASPYAFNYDMTAVSFALVLITMRALRSGFLPFERIILAMVWLLPISINWLNLHSLPVGSVMLMACFCCLLLRVHGGLATPKVGGAQMGKKQI